MLLNELFDIREVNIDNQSGAGATPNNANIDYMGLRILMRPSVFLKLAAPLGQPHRADLEQYMAKGGAIGAPMLNVDIPQAWDDGDFIEPARVTGHEGRNRASIVRKLEGDDPIEMHLFLRYYRNRDITPDWIQALNRGLIAEQSDQLIPGPLFTDQQLAEGWRERTAAAMTAAALGWTGLNQMSQTPTAPAAQPQGTIQQAPAAAPDPDQALYRAVPAQHHHLLQQAQKAGIRGQELMHFVSQMDHETAGWRHMEEQPPQGARDPQRYFTRKYEGKKILGNVKKGDGYRYRGRGYVQLTGRDNYTRIGRALGLDLANRPDLAADPDVAARIAVYFWQKRVAPRVQDFDQAQVPDVTRGINPRQGARGAAQRQARFQKISQQR